MSSSLCGALAIEKARRRPSDSAAAPEPTLALDTVFAARDDVLDVFMAPRLQAYLIEIVLATRDPAPYAPALESRIRLGASPRATLALDRCARALAWLAGRDYVSPEDILAIAPDVLRHRILLRHETEAEGTSADEIIEELLRRVPVP